MARRLTLRGLNLLKDTADMCKRDDRTELVSLYTLLGRIGKIEILRKAFLEYLKVRPVFSPPLGRLW